MSSDPRPHPIVIALLVALGLLYLVWAVLPIVAEFIGGR